MLCPHRGCPWGLGGWGGAQAGQTHCLPSAGRRAGGSPCPALIHTAIVPANNGGDVRALELMTQTQVQGAAGWLLNGSTVCTIATAPVHLLLPG